VRQRKTGKVAIFFFHLMLIVSHLFPSLVFSEGEEEDEVDHNAKDVAAAADNNNNDNDHKDNDNTISEAHGSNGINKDC
jgi:hypothetical protein